MIFYLAKGEDDACGPGCAEWIAAEGQIEADTAQRLRALLTRLGKRKLPIFFHSPGGNGTTSEAAVAGQGVEIIESGTAGTAPRITKLSTAGLSQAIATMRQRCNGV